MKTVLTYSVLILVTAAAIICILKYRQNYSSVHHLAVKPDTCYIPYRIHDTLKVRIYRIAQKDVKESSPALNDSSSAGKEEYVYIAEADTSYSDSLLSLKLKFLSPAPLNPGSRFLIEADYRKAEISRVEYIRAGGGSGGLNFSLNIGAGFGLIHHQADIYLGAGISWSF